MIDIYEHKAKANSELVPTNPPYPSDKFSSSAGVLLDSFEKVFTINLNSRDSTRNISTYILDPVFIDIYYYLFTTPEISE